MNFGTLIQNEIALERQIINILTTYLSPYTTGRNLYNFRCNVCLDSKSNKHKRRGYLLKKNDKPWIFYCHNCQTSMSALKWIKEYYPTNYNDYIKEILSNKKEALIKPTVVKHINNENIDEKEQVKYFVPILKNKNKLFLDAIDLCRRRLIPEGVFHHWFIAIGGFYKNRLIIPFVDNKGKYYFWQGLKLKSWLEPKYLSRLGDSLNSIYNYYTVDKTKPVQIVEGCIDSLFITNSIALTGLKLNLERLKEFKYRYFLLDSDEAGKTNSLKLLEKGEYVFNWTMFIRDYQLPKQDKWDVNDVCIYLKKPEGFTFEELQQYYTNSIYDKVYFIV